MTCISILTKFRLAHCQEDRVLRQRERQDLPQDHRHQLRPALDVSLLCCSAVNDSVGTHVVVVVPDELGERFVTGGGQDCFEAESVGSGRTGQHPKVRALSIMSCRTTMSSLRTPQGMV